MHMPDIHVSSSQFLNDKKLVGAFNPYESNRVISPGKDENKQSLKLPPGKYT